MIFIILAKKYLFMDLENYILENQIMISFTKYLIQRFIRGADVHGSLTELREYFKMQIVKKL